MSVTSSCVHILTHFGGFRVREHFSRARFHPFGRVSRSRELLACMFSPFWTSFVFARTSRVHVLTLLDRFRVRENFSRARSHPFGWHSRSRELLACSFPPFWVSFAFARTIWQPPIPPQKNNSPQKHSFWGFIDLFILNHNISRMNRSMHTYH
jgi:hypothetical protein